MLRLVLLLPLPILRDFDGASSLVGDNAGLDLELSLPSLPPLRVGRLLSNGQGLTILWGLCSSPFIISHISSCESRCVSVS